MQSLWISVPGSYIIGSLSSYLFLIAMNSSLSGSLLLFNLNCSLSIFEMFSGSVIISPSFINTLIWCEVEPLNFLILVHTSLELDCDVIDEVKFRHEFILLF